MKSHSRLFVPLPFIVFTLCLIFAAPEGAWPKEALEDEEEEEKITLDVSAYPEEMREIYPLFESKCSSCHGLARVVHADIKPTSWKKYIKKMMSEPDSGISPSQGKEIYKFLKYFEERRDAEEASTGATAENSAQALAALEATGVGDKASPPFDEETFKKGQKVFKRKQCSGCHAIDTAGLGEKGPGLKGIYAKRGRKWLIQWLENPEEMATTDPEMKKMVEENYPDGMLNPELKPEQIQQILLYLAYDGNKPGK